MGAPGSGDQALERAFNDTDESLNVTLVGGDVTIENAEVNVDVPAIGALTDRSGTITNGGTAQNAAVAKATRKYLLVRNPTSAAESLYFNLTGVATAASPSIRLDPGDEFVMESGFVSNQAVSVIAATTGHAFTVWEG